MDFQCDRDELHQALRMVGGRTAGYPAPERVTLSAEDGRLRVGARAVLRLAPGPPTVGGHAEVLEVEATVHTELMLVSAGSIVVKPGRLINLVGLLPDETVNLTAEEGEGPLLLRCAGYECRLPCAGAAAECDPGSADACVRPGDRPLHRGPMEPLGAIGRRHHVMVEAEELRQALRQALVAVSRDDYRPVLCAVQMVVTRDRIELLATDSYRAVARTVSCEGRGMRAGVERRGIIPAAAMARLERIIGQVRREADVVRLMIADDELSAEIGPVRLGCSLMADKPPAIATVMATTEGAIDRRVTVGRQELTGAVRRAGLIAAGDAKRLLLDIGEDGLRISAKDCEEASTRESVSVQLDGEPMQIAFNASYLLDALESIEAEEICLAMAGELDPAVLTGGGNGEYKCALMPMQRI